MAEEESKLRGYVVLVVDDDADSRDAAIALIEALGCSTLGAASCEEAIAVLDGGLGPRAAHGCAGLELFQNMLGDVFSFFDRFCSRDQLRELMRAVVAAFRRGRFQLETEAQIPGAIRRAIQQVIDFLQIARTALQFMFDHAASPGIGRGVTHRAGNAL